MNKNFTREQWFHEKLSETATPPWREGWESVSHLLEENKDIDPIPHFSRWKQWYATAAAIALLTGLSLLWLERQPDNLTNVSKTTTVSIPEEIKGTLQVAKTSPLPTVSSIDNKITGRQTVPLPKSPMTMVLPYLHKGDQSIVFPTPKKITLVPLVLKKDHETISPQPLIQPRRENLLMTKENVAIINKPTRQWHISLKVNANNGTFIGDPSTNFNPLLKGAPVEVYPSVYISREINQQFSLQTGIAFVSPVDIRNQQLNRTVSDPMRAMAANVSASEDNMQLSRLYYMDIPLTMQYHFNKNLSINSGLQVSVLEKVIGQKQRLDYDQNGILALADPQSPQPENLTGNRSAKDIIKPVDVRGVIGLQYKPGKRWSAAIQYQYGLTDISTNHAFLNDHTSRNSLVKASIGFLIR